MGAVEGRAQSRGMWIDSAEPECHLKELQLLLEGNGKPLKALNNGAMTSFLCEKDFSSSLVLSKLDGDTSEGRETRLSLP